MIQLRTTLSDNDIINIRTLLRKTGFFDAAPDEIDVAIKLIEEARTKGNNIDNYRVIIADIASNTEKWIAGYICFAKVPCSISTYEIYWLAVDSSIQGKGIGKKLINEAFKEIKELKGNKLILHTAGRSQYIPTHKFYESIGFTEEARIKDYYAIGDDGIIYSLLIK
jgi:Acetyltransferases